MGQTALDYLNKLEKAKSPLKKNIAKILVLQDEYGASKVVYALDKALGLKLYGADYIQNILYQEKAPKINHPPLRLKEDNLNDIRL